jgi:hypothetical protein
MRLTFEADHLRRLLEVSRSEEKRVPTLEQVLDPALWSDELPDARIALLEAELVEHGIALSARGEDVDPSLIGPGLILVGDEGVYLMANVPIETVLAAGVPHVAYAAEVNPKTLPFDTWWEAKRRSFGPDDGTVFLPDELIAGALSRIPAGGSLLLEVIPEQIGVLKPRENEPEI